ncbi:hypothetical protein [Pseudoalteromonas ardens]|uniref:Uncharacterized protein n=1 Tax=Pseudoalteromonas rubra TaxID=43658 RepID=A0A0L0EQ45_9GAMM|nr:hypothetical protein [Pseudoalteromonas sp. R96]KNC66592.1 hypothetical protein AC626_16085 [Pseudoalteromonas rubra]MDK1310863.1 hypothetical protein [Pseudoalteromonas sp. R96]
MFKWLLVLFTPIVFAHQHNSFGVHGLALVNVEHKIIASHLPLPRGMHARQLIFEVQAQEQQQKSLMQLINSNSLVTFAPGAFELDKLRSGDLVRVNGHVYQGHFERGGIQALTGVTLKVTKILLDEPVALVDNGQYYIIPLKMNDCLLVHKIGHLPSFDQLIQARCRDHATLPRLLDSKTGKPLDKTTPLNLEFVRSLYLETQDFIER